MLLSNTPLTHTMLPLGPFSVIPCMKGTSGNGLTLNSSGSYDPTVYRSMACILTGGLYNSALDAVRVHTVKSESLSLSGNSTLAGTFSSCFLISVMWVVRPPTASTTLPCFPGSDIHGKVVHARTEGKCCPGDTRVV